MRLQSWKNIELFWKILKNLRDMFRIILKVSESETSLFKLNFIYGEKSKTKK